MKRGGPLKRTRIKPMSDKRRLENRRRRELMYETFGGAA